MNVSGTPSFPGATALPDSLLVSWNIGVRGWLLVTSVVSHKSVVEEIVGVPVSYTHLTLPTNHRV